MDPSFDEDSSTARDLIYSRPVFNLDSIRETIAYYKEYYFRAVQTQTQTLKSELSEGIEVGQTNLKNRAEDTSFIGETHRVEQDFMKDLYLFSRTISPEKREEILTSAQPVKNMRNILFHATGIGRLPIIKNTGILSHNLADKIVNRKYGGRVKMTSGWGDPYLGTGYIDVWDPTKIIEPSTQKPYSKKPGGGIEQTEEPLALDYTPDPSFQYQSFGGKFALSATLIIKMRDGRQGELVRIKGNEKIGHQPAQGFVKRRVSPKEIIGLLVVSDANLIMMGMMASDYNEEKDYTRDELLEMVGANIQLPIYDEKYDLIWPKSVTSQELLRQPGDNTQPDKAAFKGN